MPVRMSATCAFTSSNASAATANTAKHTVKAVLSVTWEG